MKKDTEMIPRQ